HELPVAGIRLLKAGSIPKTSSGKIQRHACRRALEDDSLEVWGSWDAADGVNPRSAVADEAALLEAVNGAMLDEPVSEAPDLEEALADITPVQKDAADEPQVSHVAHP